MTSPDHLPPRGVTRRRRRALMGEINVTPFVDVMLVLLIVFMVTAPLLDGGRHRRSARDHRRAAAGPGRAAYRVGQPGRARSICRTARSLLEDLGPRLQAITERNPDTRIFVRGDKVIDYGRVMEVVGAIHAAGFTKVALVTELDQARPASEPASQGDGAAAD